MSVWVPGFRYVNAMAQVWKSENHFWSYSPLLLWGLSLTRGTIPTAQWAVQRFSARKDKLLHCSRLLHCSLLATVMLTGLVNLILPRITWEGPLKEEWYRLGWLLGRAMTDFLNPVNWGRKTYCGYRWHHFMDGSLTERKGHSEWVQACRNCLEEA